jgi:hypothetical protein
VDDDEPRPADIEVGATVRMKKVRFVHKSGIETKTYGTPSRDSETVDERENLPEELESGKTYRDAWINKHVAVRLNAGSELDEPPRRPDG